MVMIIVSSVTICGHKFMFLAVCITGRRMRRLIPFGGIFTIGGGLVERIGIGWFRHMVWKC